MGIVHLHGTHAHEAKQFAAFFVTIARAVFGHADGHVAVAALAAATGWLQLDSVLQGLTEYFEGEVLEKNICNATRGYREVEVQTWH